MVAKRTALMIASATYSMSFLFLFGALEATSATADVACDFSSVPSIDMSLAVIDGPANVRATPNGKILFGLEHGTAVAARELRGGWWSITVNAYVDADTLQAGRTRLSSQSELRDRRGRLIGNSKSRLATSVIGDPAMLDRLPIQVTGLTYKQNIRRPNSVAASSAALLGNRTNDLVDWASAGSVDAARCLGHMYADGLGVDSNVQLAAKYYSQAAALGEPASIRAIGLMHELGWGTVQSWPDAITHYRKSSELGYAPAQNSLALALLKVFGSKADAKAEAIELFHRAARSGDRDAQFNLGYFYLEGNFLERDIDTAETLLNAAAESGHIKAQVLLAELYGEGIVLEQDESRAAALWDMVQSGSADIDSAGVASLLEPFVSVRIDDPTNDNSEDGGPSLDRPATTGDTFVAHTRPQEGGAAVNSDGHGWGGTQVKRDYADLVGCRSTGEALISNWGFLVAFGHYRSDQFRVNYEWQQVVSRSDAAMRRMSQLFPSEALMGPALTEALTHKDYVGEAVKKTLFRVERDLKRCENHFLREIEKRYSGD